jgi:hypothetical protein
VRTLHGLFSRRNLTLSLITVDRIVYRMVSLFDYLSTDYGALAPRLLYRFEFLTLRRSLVLHVDWIISSAAIAFEA